MSFESLMQTFADGIVAGPLGTEIDYRVHPGAFNTIRAVVEFTTVFDDSERPREAVLVEVSRTDVPSVQVGLDEIRVPGVGTNPPRTYRVKHVLERDDPGSWRLQAEK